jgi:hypothetical protein
MKRTLLLPVCLLLIFCACNKSASNPQSTIVADIDGQTETFNNNVIGIKLNTSGVYSISLIGYNGKDTGSEHMLITLGGPAPVTTGSYIFEAPSGQNSCVIAYILANSAHGYGPADLGGTNPITVNVTSLTDTNIQGTFYGTLALDDGSSPIHKIVTNGKFNVTYH